MKNKPSKLTQLVRQLYSETTNKGKILLDEIIDEITKELDKLKENYGKNQPKN